MRSVKIISKYVLASFYTVGGLNHFLSPDFYLKIMPPYLPAHLFLVYLSGSAEMICGLLLFAARYSRIGAWGVIALLIAVFPANIHMATHPELYAEINPLVLWMRLPVQGALIWWAYWHTKSNINRGGERRVAAA